MPALVAARPRDSRGVPVPAITRWEGGVPVFTEASGDRQLLCALQNRCSICAAPMSEGDGVWHVVDDQPAKWIAYALGRGQEPAGVFRTYEVPGHYACMLYAAVACPFLANPTARRSVDGAAAGEVAAEVRAGARRGGLSGLVEFGRCVVRTLPESGGFEVELDRPRTIHTYRNGAELLPLLREVIAAEPERAVPVIEGFGPDERAVARELRRMAKAMSL